MKKTINVINLKPSVDRLRFDINTPKEQTVELTEPSFIPFRGWVFVEDVANLQLVFDYDNHARHELNAERPDVVQVHKAAPLRCGFDMTIPVGKNFRLGIVINARIEWIALIKFEPVTVLEGQHNYLFLEHDSNHCLQQYKGIRLIDEENIKKWQRYFFKTREVKREKGFKYCFLISPGKEFLFPDFYPAWRGDVTPVDQFLGNFRAENNLIYPLSILAAQRNYTYSKNDTHWTDYGAGIVAKLICDEFNVRFIDPKFSYEFKEVSGDLGIKFCPPRNETVPCADFSKINEYVTFNNITTNRGSIRIFMNPAVTENKTCLVFGDSFSPTLVNFLTFSFKRVVHIFSGCDIDWLIVDHEQPDFVLAEMTSRFLIKAPAPDFSLKEELIKKYQKYTKPQRDHVFAKVARYSGREESFYADLTLSALMSV